jgi:hypothetical protein
MATQVMRVSREGESAFTRNPQPSASLGVNGRGGNRVGECKASAQFLGENEDGNKDVARADEAAQLT